MRTLVQVTLVIMAVILAWNVLTAALARVGGQPAPPQQTQQQPPAQPAPQQPTPGTLRQREVILDPGVALSAQFGSNGPVTVTDVAAQRVGKELRIGMTVVPGDPASYSLPINKLAVVAAETFIVADGVWYQIARVDGLGLLGQYKSGVGYEEIAKSPNYAPGISRRITLVFPAPAPGITDVDLLVSWKVSWVGAWGSQWNDDTARGGRRARLKIAGEAPKPQEPKP